MLRADFSTVNVVRRISTLSPFLGVEVLTPQLSNLVFLIPMGEADRIAKHLRVAQLQRHQGLHSQSTTLGGAIHKEFHV